mmetsp:Transcript_6836/g.18347  ORF Transcript_6836/g.18347 Transcript_6836/m.18347 type:complete len:95 (-) Transcript_6836:235-519(-)
MCARARTFIHTYIRTHAHTYVHTRTSTHAHTHTSAHMHKSDQICQGLIFLQHNVTHFCLIEAWQVCANTRPAARLFLAFFGLVKTAICGDSELI